MIIPFKLEINGSYSDTQCEEKIEICIILNVFFKENTLFKRINSTFFLCTK